MKKIIILLLVLFLVSCSGGDNTPDPGNEDPGEKPVTEPVDEPSKPDEPEPETKEIDIWAVDPVYEYDNIAVNFTAANFFHVSNAMNAEIIYESPDPYNTDGFEGVTGSYEKGAVMVYKNSLMGIMDKEGKLRLDPQFQTLIIPAYLVSNDQLSIGCQLNKDYTLGECIDALGMGWYSPSIGYLAKDGNVISEEDGSEIFIYDIFKEAVKEGYIGKDGHFLFRSESYNGATDYLEGYYKITDGLTTLINDNLSYYHLAFSDGIVLLAKIHYGETVYYTDYVFYDLEGIQIGSRYEEAYGFYEGYAPVKKDGKWGYIDKNGDCVTGYVFDKATEISEGKAWVIYKGRTGRLNLIDMIENKVPFDEKTLDVSGYALSDPSHWIEIDADKINVRKEPSTTASKMASVTKGMMFAYTAKKESGGYTWYEISKDRWIADNGEWVIER